MDYKGEFLQFETDFSARWDTLAREFGCSGDSIWLIRHASYILCTGGALWSVDPTFRTAEMLSSVESRLADDLSELKFILISHFHSDHFSEPFMKSIAKNSAMWIIPHFAPDELKERILHMHSNTAFISGGDSVCVSGIKISAFPGRHADANGSARCDCLRYSVSANGKLFAFPCDTRDYRNEPLFCSNPDYLFAHVWFGRDIALGDCKQGCNDFCRYFSSFNAKHIFLTHIYNLSRSENNMWTEKHALAAKDELSLLCKSIDCCVPTPGKRYLV